MTVLRVLCSESELQEDGEVIAIGDEVRRTAARVEGVPFGTDLDAIEWCFDQDAGAAGDDATVISGRVVAISAVYVRLTAAAAGGWTPRLGSAHLEPLTTTAATREVEEVVDWGTPSPLDEHGYAYRAGYARIEEGDEHLSGWVITLASPRVEPHASAA